MSTALKKTSTAIKSNFKIGKKITHIIRNVLIENDYEL